MAGFKCLFDTSYMYFNIFIGRLRSKKKSEIVNEDGDRIVAINFARLLNLFKLYGDYR